MMILSYFASRRRQRQAAIPALAHITPSPWRQVATLRRNRLAMFCLILLAVMAVWCVLGPVWSPWKDDATDALSINQPPGRNTGWGPISSVAMSTPACCWPGASR
jgi:peptide/nickel transport system permease protein